MLGDDDYKQMAEDTPVEKAEDDTDEQSQCRNRKARHLQG